jgi:aryl-alcohol dehydrogenase-like predicted oxidoreductase
MKKQPARHQVDMPTGAVPGLDKPVPRLVLGTMIVNMELLDESFALLDDAFALGWTALDTAHVYAGGNSERAIGEWMKARNNRNRVVVISKGCHHNADRRRVTPFDLAADLHDSLARLQTDYIDLYLLHRDDPDVPVGTIVDALNEHLKAGRIRAYGMSNWGHERIAEATAYADRKGLVPAAASSPNYSLAEQVENPWGPGCVSISGPAAAEAREWYARTNTPIFAYSSLARGLFSGRVTRASIPRLEEDEIVDQACRTAYCHEVNFRRLDRAYELAAEKGLTVAQIALAYVLNQPLNCFPLIGAASRVELTACLAACDVRLTADELAWLDLREDARPVPRR